MGTKIQANTFLREYRPTGSHYHENQALKKDNNPDSKKVRQTILEHESIFRHQLQELHRLYQRQQELMNEIKRREKNKDESKEEKSQSSYLFSSSFHSIGGYVSTSGNSSTRGLRSCDLQFSKSNVFPNGTYDLGFPKLPLVDHISYDRDTKLSLSTVQASQCNNNADASMYSLYFNRTNQTGDLRITNPTDGISDSLTLSRGEVSANSCSKFNLVTKDLLKSSIYGMNGASSSSILGSRNEKNGKEHLYDDYSDGRRFDKHFSVGDFCFGKSSAFSQSRLLAEPKNEFLNRTLDTGTSVSRRRNKIFGVEICEGNDDLFNPPSNMSSTFDPNFGPQQENCRVVSFEPSSWIANTSLQKLDLGVTSLSDGKDEKSKAATEREPVKYFKNLEDINSKKDSENPKGGLPWFLKNSQVSDDMSKGKKSSYFMNMDSLQNSSRDFFKKAEIADGTFPTLKPKTELSPKILGVPISDVVQSFEDLNSDDNVSKVHFDLNLSLDEDDAPSAPSLPSAIVKIATAEIDLESPAAVIASETNTSPKEANTEKITDLSFEECDKVAAEAIIAMSSSSAEAEFGNNLEWFAEIVSSHYNDDMDDFEYMTLKLKDMKEEHYHYKPFVLNNIPLSDEDDDNRATLSKRSRRGQSRRGRQQRKDFQRDVLPGLVTLSRAQVTEDFQTFEELMKGEDGGNWQLLRLSQRGSVRSGRGRKRLNMSTSVKTLSSTQEEQPVCQIEERSLSGWGKKTRRLPRQRCTNGVLSFTVKC